MADQSQGPQSLLGQPRSEDTQKKLAAPIVLPYDPNDFGDGFSDSRRMAPKLTEFNGSLGKLAGGLKLSTKEDVEKWIEGNLFKPYFQMYMRDCVIPKRQESGVNRMATGANYSQVKDAIKMGEAAGFQKYSSMFADKSGFEIIDHQAHFLYHCTQANFTNMHGILRPDNGFTYDTAMWAVWQAFRWKMNKSTPDRTERGNKGKNKKSETGIASSDAGSSPIPPSSSTKVALEVPTPAGTSSPQPSRKEPKPSSQPRQTPNNQPVFNKPRHILASEQAEEEDHISDSEVPVPTPTRQQILSSSFELSPQPPVHQDTQMAESPGPSDGRPYFADSSHPPTRSPQRSPSFRRRQRLLKLGLPRLPPFPLAATTSPNAGPQQSTPTSGGLELSPTGSSSSGLPLGSGVSSSPLTRSTTPPFPNVGKSTIFSKRKVDEADTSPLQSPSKRLSSGNQVSAFESFMVANPESSSKTPLVDYDSSDEGANTNSQEAESTESTPPPPAKTPFEECADEWPAGEKFNLRYRYCRILATHIILGTDTALQRWLQEHIRQVARQENIDQWNTEGQQWLKEQVGNMGSQRIIDTPASTQGEIDKFFLHENFLNAVPRIDADIAKISEELGLEGGDRPRVPGMPLNVHMTTLQVVGLRDIMAFRQKLEGSVLADAMGLGKTLQMINLIQQTNSEREKAITARIAIDEARPHLMVVPNNLIEQVCGEFRRFAPGLKLLIYHGDNRQKTRAGYSCLQGELTRDHEIFNGQESNKNIVVITSINTFDSRHGPQVLKTWRIKQGVSAAEAQKAYNVPDYDCNLLLKEMFENVIVDEAHSLKRPDGSYSQVIQWLKPRFYLLATATPAMNSIRDWEGYLPFVQPRIPLVVALPSNPYLADSPIAKENRLQIAAAKEYIFGQRDQLLAGTYLRELQEQCMIRRTYQTVINGECVGDMIPALLKRRIEPKFTAEAQTLYDSFAATPLRKLMRSEGTPPNHRIMWNQRSFRHLVLLSTWIGFEALLEESLREELGKIKADPDILQKWMRKVQKDRHSQNLQYELPENMNDKIELIRIICTEAPKVATVLALLSDEVATLNENIVIWTLFPGVQIFYWVILKTLGYNVDIVSSDMSAQERASITTAFGQEKKKGKILLLTYALSSFGLNLQGGSHISIHVDVAISQQIIDQADARERRFGQLLTCIAYYLSVAGTFNDRQTNNVLSKAFGTTIADLNPTIFNVSANENEDGDVEITLGANFVEADGQLTTEDSEVAQAAANIRPLSTDEVIQWILQQNRGQRIDSSFVLAERVKVEDDSQAGGDDQEGAEDDEQASVFDDSEMFFPYSAEDLYGYDGYSGFGDDEDLYGEAE